LWGGVRRPHGSSSRLFGLFGSTEEGKGWGIFVICELRWPKARRERERPNEVTTGTGEEFPGLGFTVT
jgi:hypothetical protein